MAAQKLAYNQDLNALEMQFISDKEQLAETLKEQHKQQCQEIQRAHQLAMQALREILQHQSLEQLEEAQVEHSRKMTELQEGIAAEHEREKETLREQHQQETQKHKELMNRQIEERKREASHSSLIKDICQPANFF